MIKDDQAQKSAAQQKPPHSPESNLALDQFNLRVYGLEPSDAERKRALKQAQQEEQKQRNPMRAQSAPAGQRTASEPTQALTPSRSANSSFSFRDSFTSLFRAAGNASLIVEAAAQAITRKP